MREILTAEQPCILCAQLLEVVTIDYDDDTHTEHVRRERVEHSEQDCLSFARLYSETWPVHATKVPRNGHPAMEKGVARVLTRSGDAPLLF